MLAKKLPCRDPRAQLRALYAHLLRHQEHFEEFKHLLALYRLDAKPESSASIAVRGRLNERIRAWLHMDTDDLTPEQVLQWRGIVVEDQFAEPGTWSLHD